VFRAGSLDIADSKVVEKACLTSSNAVRVRVDVAAVLSNVLTDCISSFSQE